MLHDFETGITEESQMPIFKGFFPAQDAIEYSTKRSLDFNVGGKGVDLLRMKIHEIQIGWTHDQRIIDERFLVDNAEVMI